MSTNYRRSTHRARRYRGERTIGGTLVYAGDDLLDKHLFVHPVAPGGFDWGPDADDDRACQLAIALLAPTFGLEVAVDDYHLFATNFVKRELTGDTWTVRSRDLKADGLRTKFAHRKYPENTAPSPSDVDIETADTDGLTDAEEIALARRYDDVLWRQGNRRGNLRRLQEIRTGALDPDLNYHYEAVVDGVESGDELALSVATQPQTARHEGYETAFGGLQGGMPDVTITVE